MTLTALLLAGGQSRRMGVDKATLHIAGRPLWQRQLGVLSELQPVALRVSARDMPAWCPPEVEVLEDKRPSCGPLSGVTAGLRSLQTSHLLVLAIDLPQMTAEHLRRLGSLARPGIGIIPSHGDYFEPLCAIYPAEALAAAEMALRSEDLSVQNFAGNLLSESRAQIYEIKPEERPLYRNMNTPADLPAYDKAAG